MIGGKRSNGSKVLHLLAGINGVFGFSGDAEFVQIDVSKGFIFAWSITLQNDADLINDISVGIGNGKGNVKPLVLY